MTDNEITRRCAEVMGIPVMLNPINSEYHVMGTKGGPIAKYAMGMYHPLKDTTQAVDIIRRLHLSCISYEPEPDIHWWKVGNYPEATGPDLNRAICECAARMYNK